MDLNIEATDAPLRELLLLADESDESVDDYVGRSRCYAARCGGRIVGQGIGTAMLRHAVRTAREAGFRRLEIGTGDTGAGQVELYERCGFVRCGLERDYFRRYYPVPIYENGVECRDMVRLAMELR